MSQICILTDNTAQFISPVFPGHELVSLIPLRVQLGERPGSEGTEIKTSHLPVTLEKGVTPILNPPSVEGFSQTFLTLGRKYREIVAILISSHLSSTIAQAQEAASTVKCGAMIHIIDSQTTAVGLGLLVQAAAEAAERGISGIKDQPPGKEFDPARLHCILCSEPDLPGLLRSPGSGTSHYRGDAGGHPISDPGKWTTGSDPEGAQFAPSGRSFARIYFRVYQPQAYRPASGCTTF